MGSMSISPLRTIVGSALALGALWVLSGFVRLGLQMVPNSGSRFAAFIPATVPLPIGAWSIGWVIAVGVLAVIAIMACHLLFLMLTRSREAASVPFVSAWFSVIAATATVGLALDVAAVLADMPRMGLIALSSSFGYGAAGGALWGLLAGWVPALVARRERSLPIPTWWAGLAAGAAVVALVTVSAFGQQASYTASVQESAVLEGASPDEGALPDPYAEGDPVPTAAPDAVQPGAQWCTPDEAMLLLGEADAATGHRVQSIRMMNFSDAPCIAEGYVDVAFGDQNGNELAVAVTPGSSFMAPDPGSAPIEIPAGGSAIAFLGWDAAPTAGALVTRTLHGALHPGLVRGSWPVELDIVEGSTVEITAWQPDIPYSEG